MAKKKEINEGIKVVESDVEETFVDTDEDLDIETYEEVEEVDEAVAPAANATISKSELMSKLVGYASKMNKDSLAAAIDMMGVPNPDEIAGGNKSATDIGDNSGKNMAGIGSAGKSGESMQSVKEDLELVFGTEDLSEEFKDKASIIFEAAINARVDMLRVQIEENTAEELYEIVESYKAESEENLSKYLDYVVEQWMEENRLAVESGIRAEVTESFINGLKNVFVEHYIDVPAEKEDVVESLALKVEELESKLNESHEDNMKLRESLEQNAVEKVASDIVEGLTDTQKDKFKTLMEGISFDSVEEFEKKALTIKETYFGVKKAVAAKEDQLLSEEVEEEVPAKKVDPSMAPYVNALSRTLKNYK
jgi:hypothetical protein